VLHVLYGKDSFSLRERLEELRASWDEDGMLSNSTTVLDGSRVSLAEVTAACDTVPFLSKKRLVIVEGLLARLAGAARGRGRGGEPPAELAAWLPLAGYVDGMPESSHLVLLDPGVGAGRAREEDVLRRVAPFLDALRDKGEVREFRPKGQRELPGWIRGRADSLGLTLAPGAARLLADFVGSDLWTLAGELEKLSVYAGGRPVGEDDVRALVTAVREASIFALVDAVVEGRAAAAVKLLRQQFSQQASAAYILSMIQRQLRHLAIAREVLDAGESSYSIGAKVGLQGFPLEKLLEQASRYPQGRTRAAFRRLLEADLEIKRGVYDDELALELFVHDLAQESSPAAA
jgi:DNA polymerase-3 subunit delta